MLQEAQNKAATHKPKLLLPDKRYFEIEVVPAQQSFDKPHRENAKLIVPGLRETIKVDKDQCVFKERI